jgi:hypothetical protein
MILNKNFSELDTDQKMDFSEAYYIKNSLLPNTSCFMAGGKLRQTFDKLDTNKSDIDFYFFNAYEQSRAANKLQDGKFSITRSVNNLISLENKEGTNIDLIYTKTKSIEECIGEFDFTICCVAISDMYLYYHDTFFEDIKNRRIVINNLAKSKKPLKRLGKYLDKGYTASDETLESIGKCHEDNLKNPQNIEEDTLFSNSPVVPEPFVMTFDPGIFAPQAIQVNPENRRVGYFTYQVIGQPAYIDNEQYRIANIAAD